MGLIWKCPSFSTSKPVNQQASWNRKQVFISLPFNSKLSHFSVKLGGLAVAWLVAPQQEHQLKFQYNLISVWLWSLLRTTKQALPLGFLCSEGKAACPPTQCKGMLIFSLFLMESYLSPAKHRYLGWMGRLSVSVWSAAAARRSHSKYVWGEGRIQRNVTSDSLNLCYTGSFKIWPPFWPYCSHVLGSLLLPKPTGGVGVRNELVWKGSDIETLSPSCEEIFSTASVLFLCSVWSATVSRSWIGASPLIGGRLTCLLAKKKKKLLSISFIERKKKRSRQYKGLERKRKEIDKHLLLLLLLLWSNERTCFGGEKNELQTIF